MIIIHWWCVMVENETGLIKKSSTTTTTLLCLHCENISELIFAFLYASVEEENI